MQGQPDTAATPGVLDPHPASQALAADTFRISAAARLLPGAGGNPALDRLAELAARLLNVSSAQISLLTTAQRVAGGTGAARAAVGTDGPLEESLCTVTAASGAPLVVGNAPADARVAHLPPVTSGVVSSYLGVPLMTADATMVGALCVFDRDSRRWSDADVALLEQLAPSVLAELELSALARDFELSRLRWNLAIEAAGIGSFDWDFATGRIDWDERLQALFGYAPGEYVPDMGVAFSRIHADDRPAVDAAIAAAVESAGDYRAEFRIELPDGSRRWISARGRALTDAGGGGRLIGTAHDTTEVRTAHDRAAHLLATMVTGFAAVDRDWTVTYINASGEQVVGMPSEEVVGRSLWDVFPGLEDLEFGQHYYAAMDSGEPVQFEAYYPHLKGWFEVRAVPGPDGLGMYFLDISERRAAQERAEAEAGRLALLASVSAELAATLDAEVAVARLAELVVPTLGDWCIVTLLDDDQRLRDVGCWHVDPGRRPAVEQYAKVRLGALRPGSHLERALALQDAVVVPEEGRTLAESLLMSGEAGDLLRMLAPESAVVIPLPARGRTIGLMSLYVGGKRDRLRDEDLAIAREVAASAGLALDNARLYSEQRRLAEGLQRSLLTAPPEPDHCQIVVRYAPAAEIASVGGDWFDAFLQSDGATMLVIGDVVGHDTEAAAAMGQVRSLLRGIAWSSGGGPADVLQGLDAAMQGLQVDTTATVVIARLEQTPEERERGLTWLRWSNAGHPPPMVLNPDGTVTVLAGVAADLLMGIDPRTPRNEARIALDRGTTVLLYTDGLVERRGQSLDEGLARLRDTLAELSDLSLDDLCDQLLARLGAEADDDVAMVAVRLHPQDQPRPPEAGPERLPRDIT